MYLGCISIFLQCIFIALCTIDFRSLMSEHYLPLGKWFAKPDSSVATDGRYAQRICSVCVYSNTVTRSTIFTVSSVLFSSRGCFLCSFSFFVHAHLYICASVDMRAGPHLQPLLPSHINQALESSTGLQGMFVTLAPTLGDIHVCTCIVITV